MVKEQLNWMKKTLMMHRQKSFFRHRKNVTDFRFRRISLASSLTVGPNMDRKLNKNWDDVSTENRRNCLQLRKSLHSSKRRKGDQISELLHNDHFGTTLQNWADLVACNGRCPNWQTTKVLMDLNFCQFTTFQWAGHKLC